jgi:hypothetical protein
MSRFDRVEDPLPAVYTVAPIEGNASSYIDESVVSSGLSGVLILLGAVWGWVLFNRLWHRTLAALAAPAIAAAEAKGLRLRAPGRLARLVAEGNFGSQWVRVEWRGGPFGERSKVYMGDLVESLPLICTPEALEHALRPPPSPEPAPEASAPPA